MQAYYNDNGYPYNNAEGGTTTALETAGKALWEKQDKIDMSCTEEEFIEAYVQALGNDSMTEEEFEEYVRDTYSIEQSKQYEEAYITSLWANYGNNKLTCDEEKFAEEYRAYKEEKGNDFSEEEFATYMNDKYAKEETAEDNKQAEQDEQNEPNDNSSNDNSTPSGNNTSGGNSNNDNSEPVHTPTVDNNSGGNTGSNNYVEPVQQEPAYTPAVETPAYEEPVYTPPVDNSSSGGSSSWGGDSLSGFGQGGWSDELAEWTENPYR